MKYILLIGFLNFASPAIASYPTECAPVNNSYYQAPDEGVHGEALGSHSDATLYGRLKITMACTNGSIVEYNGLEYFIRGQY